MKTNSNFEAATLSKQEADIPQNVDSLATYSDYVRFIDSKIPTIQEKYQDYLNARGVESATGKSPSDQEAQRNSIHTEILKLSKAFSTYSEDLDHEKPLRLDMDQLYKVAELTDAMNSDTENIPAYLSQTMDEEFGKILDITTDASDPSDRDFLFANAYLSHRENNTPIIEEYNKTLAEVQAFLPDGEKVLYRDGLGYNQETVRDILRREKFGKSVMDFARHHNLIEYNQNLHREWNAQAAASRTKK